MNPPGAIGELIALIRSDIEGAGEAMVSAAEKALRDLAAARTEDAGEALDRLERTLCAILEACAFQDLAGQRLSKLEALLADTPPNGAAAADPLLNGPAGPGQGLDQAAADALLEDAAPGRPDPTA